jgi:O-antigen biosynthesis protein
MTTRPTPRVQLTRSENDGPRFSIVMPVYDTPADLLAAAVTSVVAQTWTDWELLIVDDGSSSPTVAGTLATFVDPRIRVRRRASNGGIVAASQDALAEATGAFVTFLDHDDLLDPEALDICNKTLVANPECDFLYTDEDWIDMQGDSLGDFLKPDWSPERLRCQQYVNHLSVFRRSLIETIGGIRSGFDGSQDYDLVLRATEAARQIIHIPEVLYHWRVRPGQVSATADPKVYAAARRAIKEHCDRIGMPGHVEQVDPLGVYRVYRDLLGEPLVSVVIPTRGSSGKVGDEERTFITAALKSIIERSTYTNLEFVVVADNGTPAAVTHEISCLEGVRLIVVPYERPFNFSHKINLGVAAAHGDYVLLLNDDVEVITPDWIEVMLGIAQEADVGMVGATLLFEDDTLQHAGHLYLGEAAIGHIAYGQHGDSPGAVMGLLTERECSGVTAACALMRRDFFFEVGGLSRQFPMNYNDVDLSLKVRSLGRRIVVTPFARLHHYESKSRTVGVGTSELSLIRSRWGRVLRAGEPYWRYP